MDPVRNPYSPGAGNRPPALVGRDADVEAFDIAVQRLAAGRHDRSVVLTGLRGVGKTVLLREFGRIAEGHGWICEHLEATEDFEFVASTAEMVRASLLRLSVGRRLAEPAKRSFGVLRSFQMRWNLPGGGEITLGADPVPGLGDTGLLSRDLASLLGEAARFAGERDSGIVLAIDEAQFLTKEQLTALIMGLHEVSQLELPLLVTCAGLPSLPALAGEARSYSERLFDFRAVGRLDRRSADAALVDPAADEGVTWATEALEMAYDLTNGYPYFLQEFGKQAWLVSEDGSAIQAHDVAEAVPIARCALDRGFFRVRFDRTTDAEQAYLAAMAQLGEGHYPSGQVAARLKKKTSQVGPVRDSLIRKGLCYSPRHGYIAFTVPMFDQYLRRRSDEAEVPGA